MNTRTTDVHISTINIGDTVIHDGEMKTITCSNFNAKNNTIYGDSYNLGNKPVKLVEFCTFRNGEFVGYRRQP